MEGLQLLFIFLSVEMDRVPIMADFYMCVNIFILFITAKTISYLYGFVADMLK